MSTIKKQGIRNTLITYTGVVIGFVSLLIIQPNLLKPEELGLTKIFIAAASLIATILPLGVSSVTTKFFPYFRNDEKQHHGYFGFMFLFPLAGTIICGVLIYAFKNLIIAEYIQQSFLFTLYFNLLFPFAIIMGLNMTLNAYCSSLFKTSIITFFEGIVSRLLFIVIIIFYYFRWIDLTQFMYLFVAIYLFQLMAMIIYVYSIDKPSFKIDAAVLKSVGVNKLLTFGVLLTLANFSSLGLKHLDALMIGRYMTLDYVGIFTLATFIGLVIEIPLSSLERITHTKIAQAWVNKDTESIKKIYYQSVKYLMLIGGLLLAGITTNIHDLLSLLPAPYHQGATVAVIACVGSFLNVSTGVNTSILFSSEKYIYGTYLLFFLLISAVILNLILIPLYGIIGAALATAVSSVIYNAIKYIIILKNFKMQPFNLTTVKILFAIFIAFIAGFFIPEFSNSIISMIVKSSIITLVYGVAVYRLNIIPEYHNYVWRHK